jgi:hypothetical protein
MFSLKIFL